MERTGTIYTETVVHLAPEAFQKDVPYQVAIVTLDEGGRVTARIAGARVAIGEAVIETPGDAPFPVFTKLA